MPKREARGRARAGAGTVPSSSLVNMRVGLLALKACYRGRSMFIELPAPLPKGAHSHDRHDARDKPERSGLQCSSTLLRTIPNTHRNSNGHGVAGRRERAQV
eukprot:scaffold5502_cov390-Prasinococcus_capsulatus_cf.AAC.7